MSSLYKTLARSWSTYRLRNLILYNIRSSAIPISPMNLLSSRRYVLVPEWADLQYTDEAAFKCTWSFCFSDRADDQSTQLVMHFKVCPLTLSGNEADRQHSPKQSPISAKAGLSTSRRHSLSRGISPMVSLPSCSRQGRQVNGVKQKCIDRACELLPVLSK